MPRLSGGRPRRALQRAISQRVAAMSDPVPPVPAGLVRGAVRVPALDPAGTGASLRTSSRPGRDDVPYALRVAASWSWRLGIVFVVVGVLVWLLGRVSLLVIPLMIAGLLASLLTPVTDALRRRVGNGSAVALTVVGFLVLVGLALSFVGQQFAVGFNGLWAEARTGTEQALTWLSQGPLQLTATQINQYLQDVGDALQNNSGSIVSGALSFGTNAGQFAAGVLLTLFALIFFLADGARIWRFVAGLAPARARAAVDGAGRRGWSSMASYVRIQMLVAFVDAVGIGVGAAIIGVPLALPLSVLVFLGSFIPIVGALATGSVAVLLALVANGWVNALIMLAIVLVVQQVEGHILQPLIMGPAVALHPLAVVLAVAGGTLVAGIPGALFSVPLLAVANTVIRYIAHRAWEYDPALTPPGTSGASLSPHTLQEEMTT
ncbi:putative PurR-regulated permease PerM [Arthrobacter sp. CAN_A6]|uniref:AI-2E family transporter n=1 Tax=Arthrobacter sp. CAN_A6 TaxID=2787721 RepID=UPI001A188F31